MSFKGIRFPNGCSLAVLFASSVIAFAAPVITVSSTTVLVGTGLNASVPTGSASYVWTISNGAITSTTTTTNSIAFTAGQAGTTTLTCMVTDASGVSSSGSKAITVVSQPIAKIKAPGYAGMSKTFTASVPAQSGVTYAWTITNGTISGASNSNQATFIAGTTSPSGIKCTVTSTALNTAVTTGNRNIQLLRAPTNNEYYRQMRIKWGGCMRGFPYC